MEERKRTVFVKMIVSMLWMVVLVQIGILFLFFKWRNDNILLFYPLTWAFIWLVIVQFTD